MKLTLSDLQNLNNEASVVNTINANNAAIEAALENTLSRDGTAPNAMGADLDMNSHRIYNLGAPLSPFDAVRLKDLLDGEVIVGAYAEFSYRTRADVATAVIPDGTGAIIIQGYAVPDYPVTYVSSSAPSDLTNPEYVQSADGQWWKLSERILRPEYFGRIGVSATEDTAAYQRMIKVANLRGGAVECWFIGSTYLIQGSTLDAIDAGTFVGLESLDIRVGERTAIRQQTRLAKTIKVYNTKKVQLHRGVFYGYAQIQIDNGQTPDELNLDLSSGNAVACLFAYNCDEVEVRGITTRNHFGRDLHVRGAKLLKVSECDLQGVGPTYNDPVRDGHQGNGEDAAVYAIPNDYSTSGTCWVQSLEIHNNRIQWHSFGVRTILNNRLVIQGNYFGTTPGQYHLYDTESDGVHVSDNRFYGSRLPSLKFQFENRAGSEYGPEYNPNQPMYNVGDVVRAFSILWICKTAYSPGGAAFSSTNWNQHPRFLRNGGYLGNNFFEQNGGGIAVVSSQSTLVNGRNIWSDGLKIDGNTFIDNPGGEAIRLERCLNASVTGNHIRNALSGIFGRYFSGTVADNDIRNTLTNAISLSLGYDTTFINNRLYDSGLSGVNDTQKAVMVLSELTVDDPPDRKANPRVFFQMNGIFYTNGLASNVTPSDAIGPYLLLSVDTRLRHWIAHTYGSPTSKLFRVDGTLQYQFCNHYPGYYNTAQNEPVWQLSNWSTQLNYDANGVATDLQDSVATLLSILGGKNVIRSNG